VSLNHVVTFLRFDSASGFGLFATCQGMPKMGC